MRIASELGIHAQPNSKAYNKRKHQKNAAKTKVPSPEENSEHGSKEMQTKLEGIQSLSEEIKCI